MTAQRLLSIWAVLKESVNEFLSDNCPHLAAAIAFFLILSLFPLMLAAISITGFILQEPNTESRVIESITDFLPAVSAQYLRGTILGISRNWGATGIVATVGLIWAGMAVFNAIRKSLNAAWGVKQPRSFLHERLMEFLMLIGFGALMLISLGLTTTFKIIRDADLTVFGERFADGGLLWQFAVMATSVFIAFLGFLFLYKLVPNTKVYWRHAAIGALVAAILFEIVKNFFAWFVADFASYNIVYGSVSIFITLMVWAYISAVILLFCAKLTSTYPRVRSTIAIEAYTEGIAPDKSLQLRPSTPPILANISLLTSSGVGALRRLMLGKGSS